MCLFNPLLASASQKTQLNTSPSPPWLRIAPRGINFPAFPVSSIYWLCLRPGPVDSLRQGDTGNLLGGNCQLVASGQASGQGLHSDSVCYKDYGLLICSSTQIIDCYAVWIWPGEKEGSRQWYSQTLLGKIKMISTNRVTLLPFPEVYFIFFLLLFSWLPNLFGYHWLKWETLHVRNIYTFW